MPKLLIFIGKDDFWFWVLAAASPVSPSTVSERRFRALGPPGRHPQRSREGERPQAPEVWICRKIGTKQ